MLSADALTIEEGSLYPVLQRMLVKGWVLAEWKISANNRRARFYTLTTAGAKKGGAAVGPTRRGKGSKIMAICDRHGLPVAVHVASASPYEPHLVPATLEARFLTDLPTRLIGDRGYDSDALDERLMTQYSIEMIAAHRRVDGPRRMAVRSVARADAGRSNGSSRGSTTRLVSSRAGNVMSPTSWTCRISPAPEPSSGIYEMTSDWHYICYWFR